MSYREFYVNYDDEKWTDIDDIVLVNPPKLLYGSVPTWSFNFRDAAGTAKNLSVGVVSWKCSIDYDFSANSTPMVRITNESITSTDSDDGVLLITIDTRTEEFGNALGVEKELPCYIEIQGLDADNIPIYSCQLSIIARNTVDLGTGIPPSGVIPNYVFSGTGLPTVNPSGSFKEFWADIDSEKWVNSDGANVDQPSLIYSSSPQWKLNFCTTKGRTVLPSGVNISDITAWHMSLNDTFNDPNPMVRTLNDSIDSSSTATGTLKAVIDCRNAAFQGVIGSSKSKPVFFEVLGFDSTPKPIFSICLPVTAKNSVDPCDGDVPEVPGNHYTKAETDALVQGVDNVIDTHAALSTSAHGGLIASSEKGAASGVASLDSNSKIVQNIDASKINSGTIDIARIPASALERLTQVADQAARYALTTVQNGDSVKQLDTGSFYIVVDDTKLSEAAGYVEYSSGTAAAVAWSGITDKPAHITEIAGITATDNDIIQQKSGVLTNRSIAQLKTDLTLAKGDVGLGNVANVDTTNASNITSGTLDGDRLPAISTAKKGAVPATGTPAGKFLKDDGTWDEVGSSGHVIKTGASSLTARAGLNFNSSFFNVTDDSANDETDVTLINNNTDYTLTFEDGDLSTGVLTVTHNLGKKIVSVTVTDNSDNVVICAPHFVDTNSFTIDLSTKGTLTGTWTCYVVKGGNSIGASGGGGMWELVERWEPSTAATSYTFTGLNGNVDRRYKIVTRAVNGYAGDSAIKVTLNTDTGNHYAYEYFAAYNGSNLSSGQGVNDALYLCAIRGAGMYTYSQMEIDAKTGINRLSRMESNEPASSTTWGYLQQIYGSWNNTADNITQIVVTSTQTNGIGAGSYVELWKLNDGTISNGSGGGNGDWELVETWIPSTASADHVFSGLSGDADIVYKIEGMTVRDGATGGEIVAQANADATTYTRTYRGNDGDASGSVDGFDLGYDGDNAYASFSATIYAKTGALRHSMCTNSRIHAGTTTPVGYLGNVSTNWDDTSTNITSLKIARTAGSFAVGTVIKLSKISL